MPASTTSPRKRRWNPLPRLSRRIGNTVLLKREDMQPVFSFKLRGAYNKIAHLSDSVAKRGVICASAGNHAQGVALAAKRRDIPAIIVMPQTTPNIKVSAVRDLGGEVVLHGDDYDSAYEHAQSIVRERNLAFVHPFDDPDVIAGQGTVAVEILRQSRGEVDAIFVPVGGGGLIAGIAVYAKYFNPKIKIIGVEPVDAAAMHDSLRAKKRVVLDRVGVFADGVAVKKVGEETFRLCREHVDEIVLVDTDEICAGMQDIFEDTRSIVEPSGALAVAGIKKYCALNNWQDKRVVAINSGANMNFDQLRYVAERSDVGQAREALLAVEIPEQPGSFLKFLRNPRATRGHRIQLPPWRQGTRADFRGLRAGARQGRARRSHRETARRRLRRHRHDRQRDREAARALHGRRSRQQRRRQRAALSLRISGAQGRAAEIPAVGGHALEHNACSTIATMVPTTGGCSPESTCRRPTRQTSSITSMCCTIPTAMRLTIRLTGFFSACLIRQMK